jgi:hypothetical protein
MAILEYGKCASCTWSIRCTDMLQITHLSVRSAAVPTHAGMGTFWGAWQDGFAVLWPKRRP